MDHELSHRLTSLEKFRDKLIYAASFFCRSEPVGITLHDLHQMESRIMSKISDFAAAQSAVNDQIDAAVTGLTGDVQNLSDQIAALQATQGAITPEDQALLDGIQARTATISTKLAALDAVVPPVVPTA